MRNFFLASAVVVILGLAGCATSSGETPQPAAATSTPPAAPSPSPTPTTSPDAFPFPTNSEGIPSTWDAPVPPGDIVNARVAVDSFGDVRSTVLWPARAAAGSDVRAWLEGVGDEFGEEPSVFEHDGVVLGEVDDARMIDYDRRVVVNDGVWGYTYGLATRAYWENGLNMGSPEPRELPDEFDAPLPDMDGIYVQNWSTEYSTNTADISTVAYLAGIGYEQREPLRTWPSSLAEWDLVSDESQETWYHALLERADGSHLEFTVPSALDEPVELRFTPGT
ncbi:hypothetical protein [Microbacterium excoecariae]|uniref:hypothetical protein n=1 Tax=Microbacterium excoecariae TaxID=2715210 RepID=UPI00140C8BBB|nr:hypothetical protein [Microbacterium excoecariae]NHI17154.1 hypothetical protein [Microbacterium excoecariae]